MHRLLLLRHAKSSWDNPGLRDRDRPLNGRGERAATAMGVYLRDHDLVPDLVLCSPARRTVDTTARLGLPATIPVRIEPGLYLAEPDTVLTLARAVDDAVTSLMVVGHNPTTQDLALDLATRGKPSVVTRLAHKLPTGALVVLELDGSWAELGPRVATVTGFVTPTDLA